MSENEIKESKELYRETIQADGIEIGIISNDNENDYISLTDIAKHENPDDAFIVINNWMRTRATIEFLGLWESLHNPNFKPIEFDRFKNESGRNAFTLSPQKWISSTNAIGIISKSGRGGGTFAHKDIAFEFASWISPEFKLYVITDYQRLKNDESNRLSSDWNIKRLIAKTNYRIHTDAIKQNLIPENVSIQHQSVTYANEADILNVALFGMTAKEWKKANPNAKGNIRDNATISQLIVLANIENLNATFIKEGLSQQERLLKLNKEAIYQLTTFKNNKNISKIEKFDTKLLSEGNKKENNRKKLK